MAQTIRAILLASAIATSIFGLRARSRSSHEPSRIDFNPIQFNRDIAPMINRRRMSDCPASSRSLPPDDICRGTSPSQAAKSCPHLNVSIAGAKASTASAVMELRRHGVIGTPLTRRQLLAKLDVSRHRRSVELEHTLCQIHPYHCIFQFAVLSTLWVSDHHPGTLRCRLVRAATTPSLRKHQRRHNHKPQLQRMGKWLRIRQDDHGPARPPHPPLPHPRNRKRQLPIQSQLSSSQNEKADHPCLDPNISRRT
jgi:hypothetical protein